MRPLYLLLATSVVASAGVVDTPAVGYAQSAAGDLIRVSGIAGAFVTEQFGQASVVSSGYSGRLAVVKLDATIRVLDAGGGLLSESAAPVGTAVIGFNNAGDTAIVHYVSTQTLAVFQSGEWRSIPFTASITSVVLKDADHAIVLTGVSEPALVTIRLSDGAVEQRQVISSPGTPILLRPDGSLLLIRDGSLVHRDRAGIETAAELPRQLAGVSNLGPGWAQLLAASGPSLVVRMEPELRIYELPEVCQ